MTSKGSVRYYRDVGAQWRWEVQYRGRVIGASTRGFERRVDCTTNMHRVANSLSWPMKYTDVKT